jgi:hypothetical protein
MKVELELLIDDEDEAAVMKKVSELTGHAKNLGFKVDEIEIKREEDDDEEESEKEEDEEEKDQE